MLRAVSKEGANSSKVQQISIKLNLIKLFYFFGIVLQRILNKESSYNRHCGGQAFKIQQNEINKCD